MRFLIQHSFGNYQFYTYIPVMIDEKMLFDSQKFNKRIKSF